MIAAYPFLALMPLAVARQGVNREKLVILPLEGTRFLETIQLFYNHTSANPVLPVAPSYVETAKKRIATALLN